MALLGVEELEQTFDIGATTPAYSLTVVIQPPGADSESQAVFNPTKYKTLYATAKGGTEYEKHRDMIKTLVAGSRSNPDSATHGYSLWEDNKLVYAEYVDPNRSPVQRMTLPSIVAPTTSQSKPSATTTPAPGWSETSRSPTTAPPKSNTNQSTISPTQIGGSIVGSVGKDILTSPRFWLIVGGLGAAAGLGYWYWRK